MAKNKQQDILDRMIASLSIRGMLLHPTTMFAIATAALIGGAIFLWEGHQEKIVNLDEFRLTEEKIRLNTPPDWVGTDLKQLVLDDSEDGNVSILDTKLVPRTAGIMRKIGFVERIRSIEKSKSGLDIDVVYRQPVALVELSEVTLVNKWPAANRDKTVLLPVDRHGVLMPESIGKGLNLPWIAVPFPARFANLTTWTEWPDTRIQQAAAISALFKRPLSEIGIERIVTKRFNQTESDQQRIPYELFSGSGTRIVWGNAPGNETAGEAKPEAKIRAIEAIVNQYGSLDKVNLGRIDIRSGKAISSGAAKTATIPEGFFSDLK